MKFEDYLKQDAAIEHEFADESIISNLHLTSLSMSLKELNSRFEIVQKEENQHRKEALQREYETELQKQNWLLQDCDAVQKVKTISLDQLKNHVDRDKKSCDAYFYNPNTNIHKRNLMIEFKNVNKDKILEFIKSDNKDGLWCKVADSIALLTDGIEFDGYTKQELLSNTHVIIVYGEKANTVSTMHMNLGRKGLAPKDRSGKQNKAVRFDRQKNKEYSVKETKEILDKFADKLKGKGLAACPEGYFGVPIKEPDADKSGKERGCWYTLYSKKDFQKVVRDEGFFDSWDWGMYDEYF